MSVAYLLYGLVDDTSTLCCVSSYRLCELGEVPPNGGVCWLVSLLDLRLFLVSSMISSSERGFNLCLFAPGCSVGPLIGVVVFLSLFLFLSSFRGVCNAGRILETMCGKCAEL